MPLENNTGLTLDSLLRALIGGEGDELSQLDSQNIQPTLHFLESARRRLEVLADSSINGAIPQIDNVKQGEDHEHNGTT